MPSIVILVNNEEVHLGVCLDTLMQQTYAGTLEIIVSSNASTDRTVAIAESRRENIAGGTALIVIDRDAPGKPAALNAAD